MLVVAHPGHELRLFHWLEQVRPAVFVLTDGSGASGTPRTQSTRELLSLTGASPGTWMGTFTDHFVYHAILEGDTAALCVATLQLAESLIENHVERVVADAFEFYNPAHDLCAVMTSLAVERARQESDRSIERYAFAVTKAPAEGVLFELDDEMLERKLAAAYRFQDLAADVEALVAAVGVDELRREVLQPVDVAFRLPSSTLKPFYELRGEQQVAAGRYQTVLRYSQHFIPFVNKLAAQVRAAKSVPAP